jgi:hypothetical protein
MAMSELSKIRERCPDCQVAIGEQHDDGCDVARCLATGGQRLMCEMLGGRPIVVEVAGEPMLDSINDGHDCGRDEWSGRWPGEAECEEFGWYAYFVPDGDPSWRSCDADYPGAVHDLNRLVIEATWDAGAHCWRRREAA